MCVSRHVQTHTHCSKCYSFREECSNGKKKETGCKRKHVNRKKKRKTTLYHDSAPSSEAPPTLPSCLRPASSAHRGSASAQSYRSYQLFSQKSDSFTSSSCEWNVATLPRPPTPPPPTKQAVSVALMCVLQNPKFKCLCRSK